METQELEKIWSGVNDLPGYQSLLSLMGYSEADLNQMATWDTMEIMNIKRLKEEYRFGRLGRREAEEEWIKTFSKEDRDRMRLIYLKDEKNALEKYITYVQNYNKRLKIKFFHPIYNFSWLRTLLVELLDLPLAQKKIKKVIFEIRLIENKDAVDTDEITPQMIAKAKDYPFERLIEINRNGFASCPFHNEKTSSFYTKGNYYHCFGCGETGDTIDFMVKVKGLLFAEAVKVLQ